MAPVIDLELVEPRAKGFAADLDIWNLGGLTLTRASMPGASHARRWRHLRKDPLGHWCLVLGRMQDGGASPAGRRFLGLRSLARSFDGFADDEQVLTLFIPRDLFGGDEAALDAFEGEIPDIGIGAIVADYLDMLEQRLPQVETRDWPNIVAATRSLIAACLTPTRDTAAEAQPIINRAVMHRARDTIHRHLGEPQFGAAQLCREIGVSRSKLYRLFEPLGGVTHYIQRQRLLRVHNELSDPANLESINRLADKFGFADASGFSRAFRKQFGYSPTDARAAALCATPVIPRPARAFRAPAARDSPLGDVLRAMQA